MKKLWNKCVSYRNCKEVVALFLRNRQKKHKIEGEDICYGLFGGFFHDRNEGSNVNILYQTNDNNS